MLKKKYSIKFFWNFAFTCFYLADEGFIYNHHYLISINASYQFAADCHNIQQPFIKSLQDAVRDDATCKADTS